MASTSPFPLGWSWYEVNWCNAPLNTALSSSAHWAMPCFNSHWRTVTGVNESTVQPQSQYSCRIFKYRRRLDPSWHFPHSSLSHSSIRMLSLHQLILEWMLYSLHVLKIQWNHWRGLEFCCGRRVCESKCDHLLLPLPLFCCHLVDNIKSVSLHLH